MDTCTAIRAYRATRPKRYATCITPGCQSRVSGFGNLCEKCRTRKRRFGMAEATAVGWGNINPPRKAALQYLTSLAAEHPRIHAALSWANRWLLSGEPQGDNWQGMSPEQVVKAFLHRLERHDITAADITATLAALQFVRRYVPGIVRGDRHFRFSVVRAVFNQVPWPIIGHRAIAGGTSKPQRFCYPRPRVIETAWRQIPPEVLVLAEDIATVLREHEEHLAVDPAINSKEPLPAVDMSTPTAHKGKTAI